MRAGNVYVNRNIVGAVVGVQPFGGEGLSGTGPKAGGPLYLRRLALQRWASEEGRSRSPRPARASSTNRRSAPGARSPARPARPISTRCAREAVLCLAANDDDRLLQLAAVLAVGGRALWPADAERLWQRLPDEARDRVALAHDWTHPSIEFDAVLQHGAGAEVLAVCARLAARPGPIVGVTALRPGASDIPLERLLIERSLSVNTAAAGGNASLMTMG